MKELGTKQKGSVAELRIMARLVALGWNILVPYGDFAQYDLVIEKDNLFKRVQVKNGRIRNGTVQFNTISCNSRMESKDYIGRADLFAVYCPDNDKCYLVEVDKAPTGGEMSLRVEPPKNNAEKSIHWAHKFEL